MTKAPQHWVVGLHAVQAALDRDPSSLTEVLALQERQDRRLNALLEAIKKIGCPIQRLSRTELDRRFAEQRHQGIAAAYRPPPLADESALEERLQSWTNPLLLILDHLEDPRNFGACLRSAEAAGVDAVIFPRDRAVALTPTVRKVASGAAERLTLIQVTNLARTLARLQKAGVWLVGAAEQANQTVYELDLSGAIGLVMGNEGSGLKRLTAEHCDFMARIPMAQGGVESLNVSVATGIFLFESVRQRGGFSKRTD